MQGPSSKAERNVGRRERWYSLAGGSLITLLGLKRGSKLLAALGGGLLYRGGTGHCPMNTRMGRNTARPDEGELLQDTVRLSSRISIDRSLDQVYRYWRDLSNLPRFMRYIEAVTVDGSRSHWQAETPWGSRLEWDSELLQDVPNERLAWATVGETPLRHQGRVHFLPAEDGRGTQVELSLDFQPPGGKFAAALGELLGDLGERTLHGDLKRCKELLEAENASAPPTHSTGAPMQPH